MTQNTERSEFTLWCMEECGCNEMRAAHMWDNNHLAASAWQAARRARAAQVPPFTHTAKLKLANLQERGFVINGYSIEHEWMKGREPTRGFITYGGFVGWWRPDCEEAPQPPEARKPLTDDEKRKINPYRYSKVASSIWLNGFDAAQRTHGITQEPTK